MKSSGTACALGGMYTVSWESLTWGSGRQVLAGCCVKGKSHWNASGPLSVMVPMAAFVLQRQS